MYQTVCWRLGRVSDEIDQVSALGKPTGRCKQPWRGNHLRMGVGEDTLSRSVCI